MHILDLLYPPKCPLCGRAVKQQPREPVCTDCAAEERRLRNSCAAECHDVLPQTLDLFCAYHYTEPLRSAILSYKFQGEIWMAEPFAELLHRRLMESGVYRFCDIMTYVPVSSRSLAHRGYDQTLELVRCLGRKNGLPYQNCLVKRDGAGDAAAEHQNRYERSSKSRYAYGNTGDKIKDRRVLLIDDILTTGSTLRECTRLLLSHGANFVSAAVLASGRRDI